MGLAIYRQYVGDSPQELERHLCRILLACYYMVIEDRHDETEHDLQERYKTPAEAAKELGENARRLKLEAAAVKERIRLNLQEAFGTDITGCVYASLEKYLDAADLSGALEVIKKKSRRWYRMFVDLLAAEEALIEIKNERLQQICDVHIGELKVITSFKRLSNGKLDKLNDRVSGLLSQIKKI